MFVRSSSSPLPGRIPLISTVLWCLSSERYVQNSIVRNRRGGQLPTTVYTKISVRSSTRRRTTKLITYRSRSHLHRPTPSRYCRRTLQRNFVTCSAHEHRSQRRDVRSPHTGHSPSSASRSSSSKSSTLSRARSRNLHKLIRISQSKLDGGNQFTVSSSIHTIG